MWGVGTPVLTCSSVGRTSARRDSPPRGGRGGGAAEGLSPGLSLPHCPSSLRSEADMSPLHMPKVHRTFGNSKFTTPRLYMRSGHQRVRGKRARAMQMCRWSRGAPRSGGSTVTRGPAPCAAQLGKLDTNVLSAVRTETHVTRESRCMVTRRQLKYQHCPENFVCYWLGNSVPPLPKS